MENTGVGTQGKSTTSTSCSKLQMINKIKNSLKIIVKYNDINFFLKFKILNEIIVIITIILCI